MQTIHILCGLSNEYAEDIKLSLRKIAKTYGYDTVCVSRYRKEGIKQYIYEHTEFRTLVLQEVIQPNYPYLAEELAELMDDHHLNIVVSLSKKHKGTKYLKTLYAAGILNALYEEDATVDRIMQLILYPRTRKEAREYYHIQHAKDIEKTLDVIDEEKVRQMSMYLEEGCDPQEVEKRYLFITNNLNYSENLELYKSISETTKKYLENNEIFRKISKFNARKRKFFGLIYDRTNFRMKLNKKTNENRECEPITMIETHKEVQNETGWKVSKLVDEDISDLFSDTIKKEERGIEDDNFMICEGNMDDEQKRLGAFLYIGLFFVLLAVILVVLWVLFLK